MKYTTQYVHFIGTFPHFLHVELFNTHIKLIQTCVKENKNVEKTHTVSGKVTLLAKSPYKL